MHSLTKQLLVKEQTRKIPATSLSRLWCLGNSHAKIAAYFLNYAIRKNFLAGDKRQEAFNQAKTKAALQLFGTMGYLRGAVMKVGQLIANLPQITDRELVEIFESLQFEAPPMHYSLIREVFLDELGQEPEELFAHFERRAFAAASIGQVHRARLHDGTEVAVKIQYPDIARTIESDLKTLGMLLRTMRLKEDFKILQSHITDARQVFLQEVDYLVEADYMEKNRRIFQDTDIVVPRAFPEFSNRKVLTMELLPGVHLQQFLAGKPSQEKRNHFGERISRAFIHSFFHCRTIYADLHPGNFIFMGDGRLGFIDFGCFQQFSPERWRFQMESEQAMYTQNREGLLQFFARVALVDSADQLDPELIESMSRQVSWIISPILSEGPFDFADKRYVEEGVQLFKELLKKGSLTRTDCFYNWSNRALLGHRGIMYRLQCKFDYSSIYFNEMRQVMS
ncbi:MAG: AarF/ABC1/UbiB kinase family protein [Pseudomonadota bacterium]